MDKRTEEQKQADRELIDRFKAAKWYEKIQMILLSILGALVLPFYALKLFFTKIKLKHKLKKMGKNKKC